MHLHCGEKAAWTRGTAGIDFLIHSEANSFPHRVGAQIIDQLADGQYPLRRRPGQLEIPNQADADADLFDFLAVDVAAPQLPELITRADFDLAVAGINPVADQEIVSQPVLHAAL